MGTFRVRAAGGSAQEGLAAVPVADDIHGVQVAGIAGGVEDPVAGRRRALPGPPPLLVVEGGRLRGDLVAEPRMRLRGGSDARGPIALGLARVRVALADVRGHGQPPDRSCRSRRWK